MKGRSIDRVKISTFAMSQNYIRAGVCVCVVVGGDIGESRGRGGLGRGDVKWFRFKVHNGRNFQSPLTHPLPNSLR